MATLLRNRASGTVSTLRTHTRRGEPDAIPYFRQFLAPNPLRDAVGTARRQEGRVAAPRCEVSDLIDRRGVVQEGAVHGARKLFHID